MKDYLKKNTLLILNTVVLGIVYLILTEGTEEWVVGFWFFANVAYLIMLKPMDFFGQMHRFIDERKRK